MAAKRLRARRTRPAKDQRRVNLFDPPTAPPRPRPTARILDDDLQPGHYDGDGCTFPTPGHLR